MKFKILYTLLWAMLLSPFVTFSQQDIDSDDPVPGVTVTPDLSLISGYGNSTPSPQIKSTSVIFYSDGISAAIEFPASPTTPASVSVVDQSNLANVRTQAVSGGKAELSGLVANKSYAIKASYNGQNYTLGTLSTYPYNPGDPISVSPDLYRALSLYVKPSTQATKLSNYLVALGNVSLHEKTAFAQQYFMNGAVLPASIRGQYPMAYVGQSLSQRTSENPCLCNMVVRVQPKATPDQQEIDFNITPLESNSGLTWYNNNAYWFLAAKEKGPAKQMILHNAGNLAGNKVRSKIWKVGENGNSNKLVQLSYNYLCLNGQELPAECACDKKIKFDFSYTTKLDSESDTGGMGCIFSQNASARSQDWAAAFLTRDNANGVQDVTMLQSGLAVATSTCNGGQPVSVILDAVKIGAEVIKTLGDVKTGSIGNIVEATNIIVNLIGGILEQLFADQPCNDAIVETPLLLNSTVTTIQSNDPISFVMVSGSEMDVTGKRCWESTTKINSSFHATGLLMGGYPNQASLHCCSDYVASWAFGSYLGDEGSRKAAIASYLGLHGPTAWQSINGQLNSGGALNITTELGTAFGSPFPNGGHCPTLVPNFGQIPR
ncbi:MAG: hypothetical protein JNJ57_09450 [Saprospiraceae bacterium]|nr:hypothetical protein [Saprospiraceae bacterium]